MISDKIDDDELKNLMFKYFRKKVLKILEKTIINYDKFQPGTTVYYYVIDAYSDFIGSTILPYRYIEDFNGRDEGDAYTASSITYNNKDYTFMEIFTLCLIKDFLGSKYYLTICKLVDDRFESLQFKNRKKMENVEDVFLENILDDDNKE
jgi:hypothetical protein